MKSDSQLQRDVLEELKYEPRVEHAHIGVSAKNGVVTLSGFVPDYAQKIIAEKAAGRVKGVRAIAQEIEVRLATDAKTSDAEIAQRVLDILAWDATVPPDRIQAKVEHGWVTLSGTVGWQYERRAAEKAVQHISGIKGVINNIDVQATATPSDVRERIVDAFKRSSAIDANAIKVSVDGSTVRLSGQVRGWNERKIAENAAWAAPGVAQVEDNIILA